MAEGNTPLPSGIAGVDYALRPPAQSGKYKATQTGDTDHAQGRTIVRRGDMSPIMVQKDVRLNGNGVDIKHSYPLENPPSATFGDAVEAPAPALAVPVVTPAPAPQNLDRLTQIAAGVVQAAAVVTPKTKVKVQFSGSGIGKIIVFCQEVAVSESLVVLGFPQDGSTSIFMPPTMLDVEDPLIVTVGKDVYRCLSNEWTFDLMGLMFLVLLIAPTPES